MQKKPDKFDIMLMRCEMFNNALLANLILSMNKDPVSYTHLTLPTIYSV